MSPFKCKIARIPDKDEVTLTMTFTPEGRRPVITRLQLKRSDCSADKTRTIRHNMRSALVKFYITGPGGSA